MGNSISVLRACNYFKDVNWDKLINMEEEPPYLPDSKTNKNLAAIEDKFKGVTLNDQIDKLSEEL